MRGRYLAFLDADDVWRKEKLEKELDFMRKKAYAVYPALKICHQVAVSSLGTCGILSSFLSIFSVSNNTVVVKMTDGKKGDVYFFFGGIYP